jgi:hypothetical protein
MSSQHLVYLCNDQATFTSYKYTRLMGRVHHQSKKSNHNEFYTRIARHFFSAPGRSG